MPSRKNSAIMFPAMFMALGCMLCIITILQECFYNYKYLVALRVHLPTNQKSTKDELQFNAEEILKKLSKRKLVGFEFTGNQINDSIELNSIRYVADKFRDDNSMFFKIHFNDKSTYGTLVKLLNYMSVDNHHRYMLNNNDFYIAPGKY